MTSYDAFLFDMDGLLLDTERLYMKPFLTLAQREGISAEKARAFYLTLIGSSANMTLPRLSSFLPTSVRIDEFLGEWDKRYEALLTDGVPTRPFVIEVLDMLRTQGARMAVVTSTKGASARAKLKQAGILHYFETVKAGDEVSRNKPNPEPYLEAASDLGVNAANCVAFEDSDFGTTSAVSAGCHTFQIPDLRPAGKPLPELGQEIAQDLKQAVQKLGMVELA